MALWPGPLKLYMQALDRGFRTDSGPYVAKMVSLRDEHVNDRSLTNDPTLLDERPGMSISQELGLHHLLCVRALLSKNYMNAFQAQTNCVATIVRILQQLKEENWALPIMFTVCIDLRLVAQRAEEQNKETEGSILEKAAESLLACFRVCAADNRSSDADTKRLGMLHLVNQLLKVYFRINKLHLCKPLIRAIDSSPYREQYPLSEQITYRYFVGRKAMFDSDYKRADELLTFAFEKCHKASKKNKRLILTYLVPVKMILGYMPKNSVLYKYNLPMFWELVKAVTSGNLSKIDQVMQDDEDFLINSGIYLLVEKLKIIAYRNLFRKVHLIEKTHQLPIKSLVAALHFVGQTQIDDAEAQGIVANLVYDDKIKGYISFQHKKLVVSKQNAFPPLTTL